MSSERADRIVRKQDGLEWLVFAGEAITEYTNFGDGRKGDASELVANVNSGAKPNFGYTDWRLPILDELKTLINTTETPKGRVYWSCSPQGNYSSNTMVFSFLNGGVVNPAASSNALNVRLVRTS